MAFTDGMGATRFDEIEADVDIYLKDAGFFGKPNKTWQLDLIIRDIFDERLEMHGLALNCMMELNEDMCDLTKELMSMSDKDHLKRKNIFSDAIDKHKYYMLKYRWLDHLMGELQKATLLT